MNFLEDYKDIIEKLYKISGPIIKYRIDKEFFNKRRIIASGYIPIDIDPVRYWLNI